MISSHRELQVTSVQPVHSPPGQDTGGIGEKRKKREIPSWVIWEDLAGKTQVS